MGKLPTTILPLRAASKVTPTPKKAPGLLPPITPPTKDVARALEMTLEEPPTRVPAPRVAAVAE